MEHPKVYSASEINFRHSFHSNTYLYPNTNVNEVFRLYSRFFFKVLYDFRHTTPNIPFEYLFDLIPQVGFFNRIDWLIGWLGDLIDWLTYGLTDELVDWLINWLLR